jgi:hypothetical protein
MVDLRKKSLKQKGKKRLISTRVNISHLSLEGETEIFTSKNIMIQTINQWDIHEWNFKK